MQTSPHEHFISPSLGFQNPEGTLFTDLWPDGVVILHPQDGENARPDGWLEMKWGWYRHGIFGDIEIEGRRLDASAPPLEAELPCCYGQTPDGPTAFQAGALVFPSEGCWEVTARVGDSSLTYVVMVVVEDASEP